MSVVYTSVVLNFGGLWSYKRGGLRLEVSLYSKINATVHANCGLLKEVVSQKRDYMYCSAFLHFPYSF